MKNYVAPKSVVLSMNMNENIAISVTKDSLERIYNANSGYWINTSLVGKPGQEYYVSLEELFALALQNDVAALEAWRECKEK